MFSECYPTTTATTTAKNYYVATNEGHGEAAYITMALQGYWFKAE